MLNREAFSQKRPGLKASDIGAHSRVILTVEEVEQVELDDDSTESGKRNALSITSAEFPDKPFWPNSTSIGFLIDRLGEDEEEWVGESIPLQKVTTNNPRTKQQTETLWVLAPEKWDDALAVGSKRNGGNGARTAKKAVKKSAAKRGR